MPKFLRREPRRREPEHRPGDPPEVQPEGQVDDHAYPSWLDCRELRLFGQIGDDCRKWKLSGFAQAQGRHWFEPLDHFCAGEAHSKGKGSHGERVGRLKEWLLFQVMEDVAFDDYIKSVEYDKRDWDRLYPAAAAAIMLAYCEDRRGGRA